MTDDDKADGQVNPDRRLVRPYIEAPAPSLAGEAQFSGEADDGTAELPIVEEPIVEEPVPAGPAQDAAPPAPDDSQDGRQMAWLLGAGLALIVAIVVTMVTLWPGSGDNPSAAVPPSAFAWPAGGDSAPPSAASPSAPVRSSPSPSASPSPSITRSPGPSSTPPSPPSPPPSATLAPPPAADRVGTIIGPGGACLDVSAGVVLPGGTVATRRCNGTLSQRWTVAADGTLRVGGSCAEGGGSGQVTVGTCGTAASAQWRSGAGGTLVNVGAGTCLTGSADNQVRLAACGTDGQRWTLP